MHPNMKIFCVVVAILTSLAAHGNAYVPPSSNPSFLYPFNGDLYFSAFDGIHGTELWRADLETDTVEMVADVTPGPDGGKIDRFMGIGGTLWFCRTDEANNSELWSSDGIPGGRTERIWREEPVLHDAGVKRIYGELNDLVIFTIGQTVSTSTYMVYDVKTAMIRPMTTFGNGPPLAAGVESLLIRRDDILFGATDNVRGPGLWRTEGSLGDAQFLHPFKVDPGPFMDLGDVGVVFAAETEDLGSELWITQGTPESTRLLKDIFEGSEFSSPGQFCMKAIGAPGVFFAATHPEFGRELWQTDGTAEGTVLAHDIVPGVIGSDPYHLRASRNAFFLVAQTPECGSEVWGATIVEDAYAPLRLLTEGFAGPKPSEPYALCLDVNGYLYYSQHSDEGEEMWYANNAIVPSKMLLNIYPGGIAEPYHTTLAYGRVYFSAMDPVHGRELWVGWGANQPPTLYADIFTDNSVNPSSSPSEMEPLGEALLFAADDIEHGNELWITDGTEAGTRLLCDISSGTTSSNPSQITAVGNVAYFRAETLGQGVELWFTDGTEKGTAMAGEMNLNNESSDPDHLTAWNGKLLFSAFRPYEGNELWIAEPGKAPTILKNIREGGSSSNPQEFTVWKDHVYFKADDGLHGQELWRTDGTETGTVMVRDIIEKPYEPVAVSALSVSGDRLYVAGFNSDKGRELWSLREDSEGLRLVRDIASPEQFDTRAKTP